MLKSGPEETGSSSSCATHPEAFTPPSILRQPVAFNEQQAQDTATLPGQEPEPFSRPEIERRTLPGRTIITGIAHANVVSVTLSTPSDVRTLRPNGPLHAILAVYDSYFLRANITATVRLRDGRVETEEVGGPGRGSYEPPTLKVQLREAKRLLAQERQRVGGATNPEPHPHAPHAHPKLAEEHLRAIERHLDFERSHPGILPAE